MPFISDQLQGFRIKLMDDDDPELFRLFFKDDNPNIMKYNVNF